MLGLLIGDNLGINSILGYVESFSDNALNIFDIKENWKVKTGAPRTKYSYLKTKNVEAINTEVEIWKGESGGSSKKKDNS